MDRQTLRLLKKGAEASLYLGHWHGKNVIIKQRFPKAYRLEPLDRQIRTFRTFHEPQLMNEAKKAGVATPTIFLVDLRKTRIIMEYVEGIQVKQLLDRIPRESRYQICRKIGQSIAMLHQQGIIHGDLTTSNMIQTTERKTVFLDFGLSEKTDELESRGVDLHLMKRGLNSTHFNHAAECFDAIAEGYKVSAGTQIARNVFDKMKEIERRGRYVSERKMQAQK